jgi:hypothetical protein
MLYCPKCRGEFEDWAKTCPDCHVDLVAEQPPSPDELPRFNPISQLKDSLGNPRLMLILAGATMLLAFFAFLFILVVVWIVGDTGGWRLVQTLLPFLSLVVFYPAVLLGLAALAIPQWTDSPAGAHRVFRWLVAAAVVLVLVGIGQVVSTVVGYPYPQSGWQTASEISHMLAGDLFSAGVLVGLGYLCLRRAGATRSPEEAPEVPQPQTQ